MSASRLPRLISLALLPLLAPACTPFIARPLDAAAGAVQLSTRQLPSRTWTLASLTADALQHHPDIAVARAKYDTARAAVRTAGESPNPTVALSTQSITPSTTWVAGTYGLDFDWTFETAGKRSQRQNVAHAAVRTAAANVIDATWKVRSAVRKAYLELHAATQRETLLQQAIAQQGELLQALEGQIKAGAESRSAASQARLLQAQLKLQAAESTKLATIARAALAESLAISLQGLDHANFSFAAFEAPPSTTPGRKNAITHRADILAALAEYAGTEANLRLEIAKQYPDIHLNPGYSLDAGQNKWALGIGLTLPILNQNQGPIAEAEAKRAEAAASFTAVQAKVLADCDRAAATLAAARQKLATTDALLAEQSTLTATEERLLQAGSGDRTSLLSARVERTTTAAARIDALTEIQAALGALEDATQTPFAN
jgi:outer membrane protein TolC